MTPRARSRRARGRRPLLVAAFDLGATFGWATNLASLKLGRGWGSVTLPGIRAHRLGAFASWLRENEAWLRELDVVVYETPFTRGRDATRSLWGMAGVLEAGATELNLAVVDVAVPTIKKFAAGHGRAPKCGMIDAARRLGYRGGDEHQADAYCLLKYAEENLERGL